MRELLRIGAINIYDVAEEKFDSPLLKAALSMDAVLGSHMGPRSPNTVYAYLHRHLNDEGAGPALIKGGMGALGEAFAAAAEASGGHHSLRGAGFRASTWPTAALSASRLDGWHRAWPRRWWSPTPM